METPGATGCEVSGGFRSDCPESGDGHWFISWRGGIFSAMCSGK